jgi:hypothetical protein
MSFSWPDPISLIADVITLVGIPTLAYSTRNLYKQAKKAGEPQSVGHECLQFHDEDKEVGINLVLLETVTAIPRTGDRVFLPGQTLDFKNFSGGLYEVLSVDFHYLEAPDEVDQPCPALPSGIVVNVRSLSK